MNNKVILGIDPGTNILGYGVIRIDAKGPHYMDMGVFDLRKIKDPFEKLANIYAGVDEILETVKPDELAVESPFYGKNAQVILKLGRAQGAA
ncbi:MAG: crossover junction endodeoxyribonuclease RuvC, partial [Bacteroidales bacterium]|nr:crossover junction endodeoxyribonuclease RuvC [Bacteroidales bacterium]